MDSSTMDVGVVEPDKQRANVCSSKRKKEIWEDIAVIDGDLALSFPGRQRGIRKKSILHDILEDDADNNTSTPEDHKANLDVQTQVTLQNKQETSFLALLLEGNDSDLPSLYPRGTGSNIPLVVTGPSTSFGDLSYEISRLNLQDDCVIEAADFDQLQPQKQISSHESVVFGSSGIATFVTPYATESSNQIGHGFEVSSSGTAQAMDLGEASNQERLLDQDSEEHLLELRRLFAEESEEWPSSQSDSEKRLFEIIEVYKMCSLALLDPALYDSISLIGKSAEGLNNHDESSPVSQPTNATSVAPGSEASRISGDPSIFGTPSGGDYHSSVGQVHRDFGSQWLLDLIEHARDCSFGLIHIKGHVPEFSVDKFGTHFIQERLDIASLEEKAMLLEEIMPHIATLITDIFGHYVIQKLLEHGTPYQRRKLTDQLIGCVLHLSHHTYGCQVIQKAFEFSDLDQKIKMAEELDDNVLRCICDQNASYVVEKCIRWVPKEYIQFIFESFYGNAKMLSLHPYGNRIIQRLLDYCNDQDTRYIVMTEIIEDVIEVSTNQFGNYVVQYILEYGGPNERSAIVRKCAGNVVILSRHQFASNVIEKCLSHGSYRDRQFIINEILNAGGGQTEHIAKMMKDKYANGVIQKMIETADDWQRNHILHLVRLNLSVLRNCTYREHVVARVEKLLAVGDKRAVFRQRRRRRR